MSAFFRLLPTVVCRSGLGSRETRSDESLRLPAQITLTASFEDTRRTGQPHVAGPSPFDQLSALTSMEQR